LFSSKDAFIITRNTVLYNLGFIFIGLGIWGTEFAWAHRLNQRLKKLVISLWHRYVAWREKRKAQKAARKA